VVAHWHWLKSDAVQPAVLSCCNIYSHNVSAKMKAYKADSWRLELTTAAALPSSLAFVSRNLAAGSMEEARTRQQSAKEATTNRPAVGGSLAQRAYEALYQLTPLNFLSDPSC